MNDHDIEQLCAGYRAAIEEPPYGALDRRVLRAAARRARNRRLHRALLGAAAPAIHPSPATPLRWTMAAEPWAPSPTRGMPLQPVPVQARMVASPPHILPPAAPARPAIVDLNVPGAMDALKRRRPAAYARIVAILAGLQQHPNRDVPRWMATTFNAKNVMYAPLWLTSFPPKRRLSFSLDDTRYRVVVTITRDGARVFPIDENVR